GGRDGGRSRRRGPAAAAGGTTDAPLRSRRRAGGRGGPGPGGAGIVSVDPGSPVPGFEQPRSQIERLILAGQLREGTPLPPIRHLATDLGLARGTVNRAYELLARDGWVRSAGRRGTVVQAPPAQAVGDDALRDATDQLVLVAR